jgi:hypothetical protein
MLLQLGALPRHEGRFWIEISDFQAYQLMKAEGGGRPHKYIRRVPKPGGGYRYYYSEASTAHRVKEGERIGIGEKGTIDVLEVKDSKIRVKDIDGEEKELSLDELHDVMHSAYGARMERGAERVAKRFLQVMEDIPGLDEQKPEETYKQLAKRFEQAKVDATQAKALVTYLAKRPGWEGDAKKTFLSMASDAANGKRISDVGRQIIRGAENLRDAEQAPAVKKEHVVRSAGARVDGEEVSASDRITHLQKKAAAELAAAETAMGAVDQAASDKAMRSTMQEYAEKVVSFDAARALQDAAAAYPGLRELPELEKLRELEGRWQAHMSKHQKPDDGHPGTPGGKTLVYISDGKGNPKPQTAKYRLMEADEVHASHDPRKGFAHNPAYPEGVQERAYHRDKAEQEKVLSNAKDLKPEFVANTNPDAVNGPPIVTQDGIVLGGNSRTMSLQLAHHGGKADEYKKHLAETAGHYGLTSSQVREMKNPILVRAVETGEHDDPAVLVRRYNESFTQAMDPRVDQVAKARLLSDEMLKTLSNTIAGKTKDGEPKHPTLNAYLSSSDAKPLVDALQRPDKQGRSVIDRRNKSLYIGKDGKLNEDGKTFVERVLVGHVIPHPETLSDMPAREMDAVARSVPHVMAASSHGHDLRDAFREASEVHGYMRRNNLKTLEEFDQKQEFGDIFAGAGFGSKPELSETGRGVLGILTHPKHGTSKPAKMANVFRTFAKRASHSPVGQKDIEGKEKSTAELLHEVVKPPKEEQPGLALSVPELDTMERLWKSLDDPEPACWIDEAERFIAELGG